MLYYCILVLSPAESEEISAECTVHGLQKRVALVTCNYINPYIIIYTVTLRTFQTLYATADTMHDVAATTLRVKNTVFRAGMQIK